VIARSGCRCKDRHRLPRTFLRRTSLAAVEWTSRGMKRTTMSDLPSAKALKFLKQYGELQPSALFKYVTIHPLADEPAVLERAGVKPDECLIVDCYWAPGGSALALVSVHSSQDGRASAAYRPLKDDPLRHRFHVTTRARPITTGIYEQVLAALWTWFAANRESLPKRKLVFTESDPVPDPASAPHI
jgi:hypothetical protein